MFGLKFGDRISWKDKEGIFIHTHYTGDCQIQIDSEIIRHVPLNEVRRLKNHVS